MSANVALHGRRGRREPQTFVVCAATSGPDSFDGPRISPAMDPVPPNSAGAPFYRSITDAINAANPGDTVHVRPGVYSESIILDKPVNLEGEGAAYVTLRSTATSALTCSSRGGSVSYMTIVQGNEGNEGAMSGVPAIDILAGSITFNHCDITSQSMQSTVRIHEGADPTLSNNQIFGGRCAAVSFDAGASGTLLKNAVKAHAGPAVDVHSFAKKVLIDGNALSDCTVGIIVHDQGVHSAGASLSGGGGGTGAGFSEVTAERNDIFENRVAGIELLGLTACAHPQFSANRVHDELGCGIRCGALSTGRFDDNEVFNSRGNGVEVLLNATPLLRRNTVSNCKGHGIAVMLGGGVYEGNTLSTNGFAGAFVAQGGKCEPSALVGGGPSVVAWAAEQDPVFSGNKVTGNGHCGILVSPGFDASEADAGADKPDSGLLGGCRFEKNTVWDNGESSYPLKVGYVGGARAEVIVHGLGSLNYTVYDGKVPNNPEPVLSERLSEGLGAAGLADKPTTASTPKPLARGRDLRCLAVFEGNEISKTEPDDYTLAVDDGHHLEGQANGGTNSFLPRRACVRVHAAGTALFDSNTITARLKGAGVAVEVYDRGDPALTGNTISNATGRGVLVYRSGRGTFRSNTVQDCAEAGIVVEEGAATDPLAVSNVVERVGVAGIVVRAYATGTFISNSVRECGSCGIEVSHGAAPVMVSNFVARCGSLGLAVMEKGAGTYQLNDLQSCGDALIELRANCDRAVLVEENKLHDTPGQGIRVCTDAYGYVHDNDVTTCKGPGVYASPDCLVQLTRNHIHHCEGGGVFVDAGSRVEHFGSDLLGGQPSSGTLPAVPAVSRGAGRGARGARGLRTEVHNKVQNIVIDNNDVEANTSFGFCVTGHPHARPQIIDNRVHSTKMDGVTKAHGFIFSMAAAADCKGNFCYENEGHGYMVESGSTPIVTHCHTFDNEMAGVCVQDGGFGTFEENEIRGNKKCGVLLGSRGTPALRKNAIHECSVGIWVIDDASASIEGNDVYDIHDDWGPGVAVQLQDTCSPVFRSNTLRRVKNHICCAQGPCSALFLENDMSECGGDMVVIGSEPDITLRLNTMHHGHARGVVLRQTNMSTLEGNDLYHMAKTVLMLHACSHRVLVSGNKMREGREEGVRVQGGGAPRVFENEIFNNVMSGMEVSGMDAEDGGVPGIAGATNPEVVGNRVHLNKQSGFYVHDLGEGVFSNNEIFRNEVSGINVETEGNPTVRKSHMHHSPLGIWVHDNGCGVFEDNDVMHMKYTGVKVETGGDPTMRKNCITHSKGQGMLCQKHGQGTYIENEIAHSERANVEIHSGANPKLVGNTISDGKDTGVFVHDGGRGVLEKNKISRNTCSNVDVADGGNPVLSENIITAGGERGVHVHGGGSAQLDNNDIVGNHSKEVHVTTNAAVHLTSY